MNVVNFFNTTDEVVAEEEELKGLLNFALKKENLSSVEFNIIFVDNPTIHKLNLEYRKIDRPTDVITFALLDQKDFVLPGEQPLGDIYVSLDQAHAQAKEYGHSFKRELAFLCIHGFYHLLGYDHMTKEDEKVMFTKQEEVLKEYGIQREE